MNHDQPWHDMRGRGPRGHGRSDARIHEDVCDRLTDASEVDASDIEVSVQGGEVALAGSVLDRGMRRRAEEIAETVGGVAHVKNDLRVRAQGMSDVSAGWGTPVAAAFGLDAQARPEPEIPHLPPGKSAATAPAGSDARRTVVARFDRPDDAERAIVQLDAAGYEQVAVLVTRGGALVSAIVSESRGDEAVGVLQQSGAVELDSRSGAWRATGWREYEPLPVEAGRPA